MKNGLNPPECVRSATANYRKMHDRIGNFLDECCVLGEDKKVVRGSLYAAYRAWCCKAENKYHPIGSTTFYNEIAMRGFPIRKANEWFVWGLDIEPNKQNDGRIHLT